MICAMSPAGTVPDYVGAWKAFKAEAEDNSQPECRFCGIRHAREDWHPYCTIARRFFLWCHFKWRQREPNAETQAAMEEARTTALPRYATAHELLDALEREEVDRYDGPIGGGQD